MGAGHHVGAGSGGEVEWRGGGSDAKERFVNEWGVVSMSAKE